MSTGRHIDKICAVVLACTLLLTVLFMNGEALGLEKIVDEDAERNSDSVWFTANDLNGDVDVSNPTAVISLNGDSAKVSGKGAYAYNGGVTITGAGVYLISGTLNDGSVTVDAYKSSKVWLVFNGADIRCSDGPGVWIKEADKVFLNLAAGSENSVSDGAAYSEEALSDGADGAIFAHDDLTINGSGVLTVNGAYKHGVAANDDLVITGGALTVTAAKDGVRANDSLRFCGAALTVTAEDDGIVTANEEDGQGPLYIESGSITVNSADDGIHAAGDVTIDGGSFTINAGDDGIHSDTNIVINDCDMLIETCYEGIEAVTITMNGGDVTIYPEDDGFNANGGSGSFGNFGLGGKGGDFGGRDDDSSSDGGFRPGDFDGSMPEGSMPEGGFGGGRGGRGGRDGGGSRPEKPEGSMPEGDFQPGDFDGSMPETPEDDFQPDGFSALAETASDGGETEDTWIHINGGSITILNATGRDADGLDSNGSISITGGDVRISLNNSGSNSAIDYGSENGGVCEISGGTVLACGNYSMAEDFDDSSSQCSILYNFSGGAEDGTTLSLEDAAGNVLLSWEVPNGFSSANISCPEMELGETYFVVIGDSAEEVTLESVSSSFGDAQSSMFGGFTGMGGGMRRRGGFGGEDASQMEDSPAGSEAPPEDAPNGEETAPSEAPEGEEHGGGGFGGPGGRDGNGSRPEGGFDSPSAGQPPEGEPPEGDAP